MASRNLFLALILFAFSFQALIYVTTAGDRRSDGTGVPRHPTGKDSVTNPPSATEPGVINPGTAYPGTGAGYPGAGVGYPGIGTYGGVYPGQPFSVPGYGFSPIYPYYFPPYYQGPNSDTGYYPGPGYPGTGYPNTRPYHIYPAPQIPTVP